LSGIALLQVAVWHSRNDGGHINEVTLRWARLGLGGLTVFGRAYNLGM